MKTILHYYYFNTRNEVEVFEYKKLCQLLRELGLKKFDSISSNHYNHYHNRVKPLDGKVVNLETDYLFSNQWNIAEGLRVFDWAEAIYENRFVKEGQWLEQTEEMKEIRGNTKKCGYCGGMSIGVEIFCTKCLGSRFLEERDLHLLRMFAIDIESPRQPLTEREEAYLLPLYEEAQGLGKQKRDQENLSYLRMQVQNLIPEAEKKAKKLIEEAHIKTTAFTWLLDNKFRDIDNVIYYSHTERFGFGWRNAYGNDVPEVLKSFPFPYEVK